VYSGCKFLLTVLITGCGGAAGQGILKALRNTGDLRLIGSDADRYAGIFHLKKSGLSRVYCLPYGDGSNYISEVINLCKKERIDVIFPGTDGELVKLAAFRDELEDYGTKVVISPVESVTTCRDKWLTYSRFNKVVPMVRSALPEDGIKKALNFTGLPAAIKPRIGWGAKQVYKVRSASQAKIFLREISKPIIQTWLEGDEYTVDCLTDKKGRIVCVVPRRRIKIFSGLSFEGVTVRDKQLIDLGRRIAAEFFICGPFNFQAKTVKGKPLIFEINPRFSGSGILTVRAGANIPLLAVQDACGTKIPQEVGFDEGVVFSRYFDEVVFKMSEQSECDD
jgi:carbamoyl-phosphate synthase large subunit